MEVFTSLQLYKYVAVIFLLHRYEERNVACLGSIRKYGADVPSFMHNRPHYFVAHCMKRMPPSCLPIPPESITDYADGVYTVRSSRLEATAYTVRMCSNVDSSVPACDCPDWQRRYMPCKHLAGGHQYMRTTRVEQLA